MNGPQVLLFLGPDATGDTVLDLLSRVEGRVDAAFYEVGPGYVPPLLALANRGVEVRVVVDDHPGANPASAPLLTGGGVALRVAGGGVGHQMHSKLAVLGDDAGATVLVMTGNLILRDAPHHGPRLPPGSPLAGTREWGVAVSGAPGLTASARAALAAVAGESRRPAADWRAEPAGVAPVVGTPLPVTAPLRLAVEPRRISLHAGVGQSAEVLLAAIDAARRNCEVTIPYVHGGAAEVRRLLAALAAAGRRGCDVRLLLGADPVAERGAGVPELASAGIEARLMDPLRSTTGHAKGLVADGTVILGSANWSRAGLGGNHEACLRLDDGDAAAYFGSALRRDWELSGPSTG